MFRLKEDFVKLTDAYKNKSIQLSHNSLKLFNQFKLHKTITGTPVRESRTVQKTFLSKKSPKVIYDFYHHFDKIDLSFDLLLYGDI